jgi:hypothetical protein
MDKQIHIGYEEESALIKNVFKHYPNSIPTFLHKSLFWDSTEITDFYKSLNKWLDENIIYNKKQHEFMMKEFMNSQNSNDIRRMYEND